MESFLSIVVPDGGVDLDAFDCRPLYHAVRDSSYAIPGAAVVAYVAAIFVVLPAVRPTASPSARHAFAAWNFLLSAFSAVGVYFCVPYMAALLRTRGVQHAVCSDTMMLGSRGENAACFGGVGLFMSLFMLSKFPELLDTAFLVYMRKHVDFLHWYHHITVLLYSWFAYANATPSAVFFGTMNYTVHAVMYFYFGASQYTKALRFLRRPITALQLTQMALGVGTTVLAYLYGDNRIGDGTGCSRRYTESPFFLLCFCLYGSYLVLFAKLYWDSYVSGARDKQRRAAAVPSPTRKR